MFSVSYFCIGCGTSVSLARSSNLPADFLALRNRGLCSRCWADLDRWHRADDPEQLPSESGSYLVCSWRRDVGSKEPVVSVFPAHFYANSKKWSHRRRVIAWRPLPLPPSYTLEV